MQIAIPIGVQKPGSQYSPAIVVYTLHSIVMVLLYLYLFTRYIPLATVINFISPFSQLDAFKHKYI